MEFHKKIYIYNIVHWIKNADKILKEEYYKENINNNKKLIVMEIDELFTYIKKPKIVKENHIWIKGYGLLLTGIKEE